MTDQTSTTIEPDLAEARTLAETFAREVRSARGERVAKVRLYGSAARGDWTEESDVDVLVLLSALDRTDADAISRIAFHLGPVTSGLVLRPLVMTTQQFEHLRSRERRIALDIEREGIDL